MADAMVTARMPAQKKEEGARIFAELGTNPSKAVNDLYDYVIREHALPFDREEYGLQKYTASDVAAARALARGMVVEGHRDGAEGSRAW